MTVIELSTEIAAPPESVRHIFLDFEKLPTWHSGNYIKSLKPTTASSGHELKAGDTIDCEMGGVEFVAVVEEVSPSLLRWRGPPISTITGHHTFYFRPSSSTLNGTTFVQYEEFSGLLSFLVGGWSPLGKSIRAQWEGLAKDLKTRAESVGGGDSL